MACEDCELLALSSRVRCLQTVPMVVWRGWILLSPINKGLEGISWGPQPSNVVISMFTGSVVSWAQMALPSGIRDSSGIGWLPEALCMGTIARTNDRNEGFYEVAALNVMWSTSSYY